VREAEEQIKDLVDQCLIAVRNRDEAVLDRLLDDDFIIAGWQPDGRLADKKFYIADAITPVDIQSGSYKCDAWKFRFFGDVALVNYILDIHAVVNGHEWGGTVLISSVWRKTADGDTWRLMSQHTSPIKCPIK